MEGHITIIIIQPFKIIGLKEKRNLYQNKKENGMGKTTGKVKLFCTLNFPKDLT